MKKIIPDYTTPQEIKDRSKEHYEKVKQEVYPYFKKKT